MDSKIPQQRSHKTEFDAANTMINDFQEIRQYIIENNLVPGDAPQKVKNYFSSNILSFAFYKKEIDEYFDKLEKDNPINSTIQLEQFGIRIYFAADATGKPSLVMMLCKLIGTGTTAQDQVSEAAEGSSMQHPRLVQSSGQVRLQDAVQGDCEPEY